MAFVLAEYGEPVVGPKGRGFRARACALPTRKGVWQGWIEFNPINGAPTFRSPHEIEQPTRTGVSDWAAALTQDHLTSALERALVRLGVPVNQLD